MSDTFDKTLDMERLEARKGKHQMALAHVVQMMELSENPKATSAGALNPMWVEWLMGWPQGWTDLKPLGTDKFQSWLLSLSDILRKFC